MQTIRNSRIGNLILGDSEISPVAAESTAKAGQGSAGASSSIVVRPPALPPVEHTLSMSGPPVYEGVPVAHGPTHQQISCMTCSQALLPHQRQVVCHVCSSYMHHDCVEVLTIGTKWSADMCLVCQQGMTRQLRAISAIELQKGHQWDQDDWFATFQDLVGVETGYGVSSNRDLNAIEMKLASAIKRGLNIFKTADSPTTNGDTTSSDIRDSAGEPTPVAIPNAPSAGSVPHTTFGSARSVGSFQAQQVEAEPPQPDGTGLEPLDQRTGIREERLSLIHI